ncbi:hypothetical protein HCH_01323 [Hahella chejuensis KCTC 2396]|uniref:Uncharacterized protein n=1 Tax=Hahella chejuensis (strain KCTC 2396) TaxID=349521 RepID=Q2SMD2_HAHCH|nr:hypothetical protein HCH_01323 [Hahella chejuensis KCTC 2396]
MSRTCQQVDGYTPIAAYLGSEGWCQGLDASGQATQHEGQRWVFTASVAAGSGADHRAPADLASQWLLQPEVSLGATPAT